MQPEDWLEPTRDRLRQWARWLRTTSSPIGGAITVRYKPREIDPVHDTVPDVECTTGERIDLIMCRVRAENADVYRVLFEYYYHWDLSERELATQLRVSRDRVTKMRLQGETMVHVWWRMGERGVAPVAVASMA